MTDTVKRLGPEDIANRGKFVFVALLFCVSGVIGVIAAVVRWLPCGDSSDHGLCASTYDLIMLPMSWFFVALGIADLLLALALALVLNGLVNKILSSIIVISVAATGLSAFLVGVGVQSLVPVTGQVLMYGWWVLIPLVCLVAISRMANAWEYMGNVWGMLALVILVLGSGIPEYFLPQIFFAAVDTPRGTDGVRFAMFLMLGVLMISYLVWSQTKKALSVRR